MRKILASLSLLLLILNGCGSNSTEPENKPKSTTAIIAGHLYNAETNQRLVNAKISIVGGGTTITTNSKGEFKFSGLIPGGYAFMVNKDNVGIGKSTTVNVRAGDSLYSPIGLHPVTGTWFMTIQWQGGKAFNGTLNLKSDQTWTISGSGSPASGTWSLSFDQLVLFFPNGTQYLATVTDKLSGSMIDPDGDTGFWSAIR